MQGSIKRNYEPQSCRLLCTSNELSCVKNAAPKVPFGEFLKTPHMERTRWPNNQPRNLTLLTTSGIDHRDTIASTSLLLENCDGRKYDRKRKQFSAKITVERGHLLSRVVEDDLAERSFIHDTHDETNIICWNIKDCLFMKCLEFDNVYLRVSVAQVALLTDLEKSLLKAVCDVEIRFRFYQDYELFTFVSHLKIGDRVVVQLKATSNEECALGGVFQSGWIEWFGEPVPDKGFFFGVHLDSAVGDMDGFYDGRRLFSAPSNGAVLVSGDRLRNPRSVSILDEDPSFTAYSLSTLPALYCDNLPSRNRVCEAFSVPVSLSATHNERIIVPITCTESVGIGSNSSALVNRPVVRNVPIQIVPASSGRSYDQVTSQRQDSPASAPSIHGKFPVDDTIKAQVRSNLSQTHRTNVAVNIPSCKKAFSPGASILKDSSRGLFETKAAKVDVSLHTVRLESNDGGLLEGDRVVWFDSMAIPRRGTVRWIGYLRGHANVYVGVDFDEAIGGGTGYFEGTELFRCAPNHAGLLPISVCMKEADLDDDNNVPNIGNLSIQSTLSGQQRQHQSLPPLPPPLLAPLPSHTDFIPSVLEVSSCKQEKKEFLPVTQFSIGSCVEVSHYNEQRFGVVKWISTNSDESNRLVAVEIEGDLPFEWQTVDRNQLEDARKAGVFENACSDSIALVPYYTLRPDNRFASPDMAKKVDICDTKTMASSNFGSLDSGIEVRPCLPTKNVENLIGRMKGIQGFRNSCYLDTTLYAMFAQCSAFDSILESKCETAADSIHTEVTDILKTEIVYPLRRFHFIRADHVLKLRRLLERLLPGMKGLTTAEKDPEELLNALFSKVLRVEPFFITRNMTDGKTNPAYICPLITEDLWSEEQRRLISVQSLLERSLFASNIMFAYEPRILILQLPRYGQQKVFDKIFPPQEVDITHLIYDGKRPCICCGKLADMMCPECFLTQEVFISEVTYCGICYERTHNGLDHQPQQLFTKNNNFFSTSSSLPLSRRTQVPQKKLQLSSVLCIETSHYVAFVRASGDSKWVFFDSMADRVGLSDGYNVPEVKLCEKMSSWLCATGWNKMRECINRDGHLPNDVESDYDLMRLLSDCYICIYADEDNKNEGLSLSRFFI